MPKISIIIPVFKAENFLYRCVDSILSQTFTDWECILVDDGSPDRSGAICDEYAQKDARIRVIHKENGGVSSARNLGLDYAKGQWITFIDADDYVDSCFCNINEAEINDIIIKRNYIVDLDNSIKELKQFDTPSSIANIEEFLSQNLYANIFRNPWGKFFKSNILKIIRFPLGQRIGEDTAFMFTVLSKTKKIVFNNEGGYYWQKGEIPDSLKYKISYKESIQFTNNLYKRYEQINISCPRLEKFLIVFFFSLIDEKTPSNTKQFFNSPIIERYYKKLQQKGHFPLSMRLWKTMPYLTYACIRIRAILRLNFIHLPS